MKTSLRLDHMATIIIRVLLRHGPHVMKAEVVLKAVPCELHEEYTKHKVPNVIKRANVLLKLSDKRD